MDDVIWFTKNGVIVINNKTLNNNVNRISYTEEYLSKKIDEAYTIGNGKGLIYWCNIYEEQYGIRDIIC